MTEDVSKVALEEPTPESSVEAVVEEKMFPASAVSKIAERERLKGYEKAKKELQMELEQQSQQMQQQQEQPEMQRNLGGIPQLSEADIERIVMQKAPEALAQQINQYKQESMIRTFSDKMQSAETKYPGLEEKLSKLNYQDPRMHNLIDMINGYDNTGDMMHELLSYPHKLGNVLSEISSQPFLAQQQLQSLSGSIKQNQEAKAEDTESKNPMSQIKPSNTTAQMADIHSASIHDLMRMQRRNSLGK